MNWCIVLGIGTLMADCKDGEIRLVGGNTKYEGRVEVCINHVWGTVCSSRYDAFYFNFKYHWGAPDTKVVCRQLGHQDLGIVACYKLHILHTSVMLCQSSYDNL